MAKKPTPLAGEATTTNYGWVKPTVGSSVDLWGGYINADLDGIDSIVHGIQTSVPAASTTTPLMDGTGAVGAGTTWARADHVHPTDARIIGDNRIINGDMRIDQRNNGAAVANTATASYSVDRWGVQATQASKFTWGRNLNTGAGPVGFPYYFGVQSGSAFASAASDAFQFYQLLEGDAVSDFAWGTASAQPVTLSFWAMSGQAGTYSASISNYAGTRSYPFTFSLPSINTWTKIVVTIPGDTTGTWVVSGNAASLGVHFDFGCGSTFRGPANAWASATYVGVTGSVSIIATNGATFYVTGVKLEIGSVATPFNRQSLAKSLADCQRYYQGTALFLLQGYANAAGVNVGVGRSNPVVMRAAPTIVITSTASSFNINTPTVGVFGATDIFAQAVSAAAGTYTLNYNFTASAEL